MDTSFAFFVTSYISGSIEEDITWRAYDIPAMVGPRTFGLALKQLGFRDERQICDYHDIQYPAFAKNLACLWYVWKNLSEARAPKYRRLRNEC